MLTDTEPKQEEGTTRGSTRVERAEGVGPTEGLHLFLAGTLPSRHFVSGMHETSERRK